MPVITDLTIPSTEFELGQLVLGHPGMFVELERIVPLEQELLPFLWVSDGSATKIEETLLASPDVESVVALTELGDRILYQIHWESDIDGFIDALVESKATILEGSGDDQEWAFQLRFPDHESMSLFGDECARKDISYTVRSVYNPHPPVVKSRLTSDQRRTLQVAHEKGYFEVPRRTSLSDLSEYFGVSRQAVSQRLRRGLNNLLTDTEL